MKSSTYYFHIKTKILAHFQICISVPLKHTYNQWQNILQKVRKPIKTGQTQKTMISAFAYVLPIITKN